MEKKEAMKILKDFHDKSTLFSVRTALDTVIPELNEDSKDERIRKALIKSFEIHDLKALIIPGFSAKDAIAWLEKQGEHANFCNKIQVGDKVTRNEDGILVNLSQLERVAKPRRVKPADKVEPKFKVGDWIVWQDKCYKVNYNGCGYELVDQNGLSTSLEYGTIDENAHLWTIEYAKDGDVLVCNEEILLFKSYSVQGRISLYCWYNGQTNNFHSKGVDDTLLTTINKICPATKEQRDTLFAKIKEAGYEWNAEKKELKKIEQKPVNWSDDEGKQIQINPSDYINDMGGNGCYLKNTTQASTWSEEDEKYISSIIKMVEHCSFSSIGGINKAAAIAWLKSFRPQKYVGYNPYKATVESIAKMCNKYENLMWDETEAKGFLCEVSTKCHEAAEYNKKISSEAVETE